MGDKDRVDVIMTNPPFGGEEERGILGNFPEDKQTAETALLFLQLIMRKLRRPVAASKPGRARHGCPQRHALRRRRLRPHQRRTAEGVQPAHDRAAAERRLCALHQHPHEYAFLRPLRPDERDLVLRAAVTRRAEELHQDAADAVRGVRRPAWTWWKKRKENEPRLESQAKESS